MKQADFDEATAAFTRACIQASHWKDYFGAAYSSRITAAIADLKEAISKMEETIKLDRGQ